MNKDNIFSAALLVFIFIVFPFLSGCASTRSPDAEIIVREFDSTVRGISLPVVGAGVLGGVRVSEIGDPTGCLVYQGKRAYYRSKDCLESIR